MDLERNHAERMKAAKALIEEHGALEADFLDYFFAQVDQEDLSRYSPQEIASIAHQSFTALAKPFVGKHRIDIFDPKMSDNAEDMTSQVTIVELHNINKPFLVDSIMGELQSGGFEIHLVLHPILTVERDDTKNAIGFHDRRAAQTNPKLSRESVIHVHVSRLSGSAQKKKLFDSLDKILNDVEAVVIDWKSMLLRLEETIAIYRITPPPLPQADIDETIEFLRWLVNNNFTLLGMREYAFDANSKKAELTRSERKGLGLLRDRKSVV